MELIRKNWWVLALQGLFLVALGALVLLETFQLSEVINFLGIIFIIFGVVMLIWGIRSRKTHSNWWGLSFFGLVQLILGLLIVRYPTQASDVFNYTIGGFAVLIGLAQFILGFGRRNNRLMFFANGVVSAVVGVLIIFDPFESEQAIPYLVALFSVILGIFIIYYSFRARNVARSLSEKEKEKLQAGKAKAEGKKTERTREEPLENKEQPEDADNKKTPPAADEHTDRKKPE